MLVFSLRTRLPLARLRLIATVVYSHRTMSSLVSDTLNPATLLSKRFRPNQIPDLAGRVALVTGGSAGIGFHDVAALAQHNAKVHFISANPEHGKSAEQELNKALQESGAKGSVQYHQLDMMELKKVDGWAKQFAQQESRLDILIANAGIGQAPFGMTPDGLERHFEVSSTFEYQTIRTHAPRHACTGQ